MKITAFISGCLAYGIQIYGFEQNRIIEASEKFKIPDDELKLFNRDKITKYVKALDLATREDSRDWTVGFDLLKDMGFQQQHVIHGHRKFVTLVWKSIF